MRRAGRGHSSHLPAEGPGRVPSGRLIDGPAEQELGRFARRARPSTCCARGQLACPSELAVAGCATPAGPAASAVRALTARPLQRSLFAELRARGAPTSAGQMRTNSRNLLALRQLLLFSRSPPPLASLLPRARVVSISTSPRAGSFSVQLPTHLRLFTTINSHIPPTHSKLATIPRPTHKHHFRTQPASQSQLPRGLLETGPPRSLPHQQRPD